MTFEEYTDKAIKSLEQSIKDTNISINMGESHEAYGPYIKQLEAEIQKLKDDLIEHILLSENTAQADRGLDVCE